MRSLVGGALEERGEEGVDVRLERGGADLDELVEAVERMHAQARVGVLGSVDEVGDEDVDGLDAVDLAQLELARNVFADLCERAEGALCLVCVLGAHEFAELGEAFWPALRREDGHEHRDDLGGCAAEHVLGQAERGDDGLLDVLERLGRDEVVVEEDVVLEDEAGDGARCEVFGGERVRVKTQ